MAAATQERRLLGVGSTARLGEEPVGTWGFSPSRMTLALRYACDVARAHRTFGEKPTLTPGFPNPLINY
jgi:hypothetical protein